MFILWNFDSVGTWRAASVVVQLFFDDGNAEQFFGVLRGLISHFV